MEAAENTKKLSWIIFLLLSVCILCGRLVYWYLAAPQNFPFTQIKIVATFQNLTREQLTEIISPYLAYSYFSLPIAELKQDIKDNDWVKSVLIEKSWPNGLIIKVGEKKPKLLWNNRLMTKSGEVIRTENINENLPHLFGPSEQKEDVLQKYEKLSKILSSVDLSLTMLKLYPNQSWVVGVSGGILIKLGKRDTDERLTRFCKAYRTTLIENKDQLAIVDLRYARGMAVKWKKEIKT